MSLNPRLNILVGDNGAGKTTVLESLVVMAKGRSFRTGQVSNLIGPGNDRFRISAQIVNSASRNHRLGIERSGSDWRARRDGQDVRHISELARELPLVVLEPNSHQLISGAPEGRRKFMDWSVFHVEHGFLGTWRRYVRAVKQRNAALRAQDPAMVQSLDPLVTDLGEDIHRHRSRLMDRVEERLHGQLAKLSPDLASIGIRYQRGWSGASLQEALTRCLQRDMDRGSTGAGPHRAEVLLTIREKPAREVLSRGEQKALATAMLLTQAEIIADQGESPILLMDDLASEFDPDHLAQVLETGRATGAQLWITGTRLAPYRNLLGEQQRVFHVEHGKIVEETCS